MFSPVRWQYTDSNFSNYSVDNYVTYGLSQFKIIISLNMQEASGPLYLLMIYVLLFVLILGRRGSV